MIRFLLRFIGLCLLAAAFIFLVYDGTKSIANQHVVYTRISEIWANIDQASLNRVEDWVKQRALWLWDPYLQAIFDHLPAWIVLGVVAMILIVLGRKKKPLIGYARN
jgi:ABC-type siderophore export system fused ATPase/permease subunit